MEKNILITTQRVDTQDPILHFFLDWIREFAKHYDTVYVVCLQKGIFDLPKNVVVLSLGKEEHNTHFGYIYRFYKYVTPLILGRKVSKVFVHMNEIYVLLFLPFLPIRKIYAISMVWWKTHAKLSLLTKLVYFSVDKIFTASEHSFKIHTKKKEITGHGINTEYFILPKEKKYGEKVRIFAIGRAVPVKHYEDIIRAIAILVTYTKNFTFTIIGVRPEDKNEYVTTLEKQVDTLGLREYVSLNPPIPFSEMVGVYHGADIVVNMTYPNTFDKVLLEAMACGVIPVTATPSYESILAPHNLFPKDRSPEELARVLLAVCSMNVSQREVLGEKMREEVVMHHNVESLIKRISQY